jgi:hypothetical protein
MRHFFHTRVCLLALTLIAVTTVYTVNQPSPPRPAPFPAMLPQERDAPVKPIDVPGHWRASGQDQGGRLWDGYLVVERSSKGHMRAGYFEWFVKEGGGRYHFEGTFDPVTRRVRWTGYCIQERFGVPAMATYLATLSADGMRLTDGSWSGGISVPGTWSADYIGD